MSDEINKPAHYQFGQMEAWDIIELAIADLQDRVTAYHVASALKYLLRASRKNGDKDVAKACAHLKREVARHVVPAPQYSWSNSGIAFGAEREAQSVGDYGNPVAPRGTP